MRRVLVLALALLFPACDRELLDHDGFSEPDLSGSVRIPLATTSDDGTTYLLRDATLEISGAAMMTLSSPALGDKVTQAEALTAPLPAGSYTLYVRPGFQLIEVDASGHERRVDAQLASINPLHFTLREIQDTTLKLSFAHDGRQVVFGAPQTVRVTRAY